MTDPNETVRDALVGALKQGSGLLYQFGYAERKHLEENFDPAFVAERYAEAERKSRGAVWACTLWLAAVAATLALLYFDAPRAVSANAFLLCVAVGGTSAYSFWKWRTRRLIYRALQSLPAEKQAATTP